jgi:hypothetical protein
MEKTTKIGVPVIDWQTEPIIKNRKEKIYSADSMINAYFKGKEDEKNKQRQILENEFSINLRKVQSLCVNFFYYLIKEKISCQRIYLRALSLNYFDAIFLIEKNDFMSPDFMKVNKNAVKEEKQIVKENFDFEFIFMPLTKHLNKQRLLTDGYILTYGQK